MCLNCVCVCVSGRGGVYATVCTLWISVSRVWSQTRISDVFVRALVCLHVSTPSFGHGSEPVFVMRDPLDDLIGWLRCISACVCMPGPRAPRTGNVFTASEKLGRDWKHFESCLDKHTQTHTNTHRDTELIDLDWIWSPMKKYLIFWKQFSHHQSTSCINMTLLVPTAVDQGESTQLFE